MFLMRLSFLPTSIFEYTFIVDEEDDENEDEKEEYG